MVEYMNDDILLLALREDVGTGDLTTLSTVAEDAVIEGNFIAKEAGIVCGLAVAADMGAPTGFVYKLPLAGLGLYWILPSAIAGIIGGLLPEKK